MSSPTFERPTVRAWITVCAGAMLGPASGGQLVLLGKPLGGALGVPGAVIGYIALTGLVVGCLTVPLCLWLLRRYSSTALAAAFAVLAGSATIISGLLPGIWLFTVGVLVAGACAGPLLIIGRALVADVDPRSLAGWHAVMIIGVALAAVLAVVYDGAPGNGLIISGSLGTVVAPLSIRRVAVPRFTGRSQDWWSPGSLGNSAPLAIAADRPRLRRSSLLLGYAAVGLAIGGTTLPALHLLLFRWNALGTEQATWLLLAAIPAVLAVALPGRIDAVVPLLILAAGGPLLVGTAPGALPLATGMAVTLTAACRAAALLDTTVFAGVALADRAAAAVVTAAVAVAGALVGLGMVDLLGRLIGTGSALAVLVLPILAVAFRCGRHAAVPTHRPSIPGLAPEGGAS
ncbi:hypothetical protein [Nocardia brasiliensis]|uniref:hypothetical protein n=1 Tax=Nocardia brasiliensis TaxID=37326 RepID=UPI00367067E2